jgi:hypothetical protein
MTSDIMHDMVAQLYTSRLKEKERGLTIPSPSY